MSVLSIPFREALIALLPRVRIQRDADGFDFAQGRYGRLEDRGLEPDGTRHVWAFTDARLIIHRLRAIPGVTLTQVGDGEAAGWMRVDDVVAIRAVAALLRVRMRRAPETGRSAEAMALMRETR